MKVRCCQGAARQDKCSVRGQLSRHGIDLFFEVPDVFLLDPADRGWHEDGREIASEIKKHRLQCGNRLGNFSRWLRSGRDAKTGIQLIKRSISRHPGVRLVNALPGK